jgi:hypothetical protein
MLPRDSLAQLEVKKQPQAQLLRTVAEVEGGAEDRVPLGRAGGIRQLG